MLIGIGERVTCSLCRVHHLGGDASNTVGADCSVRADTQQVQPELFLPQLKHSRPHLRKRVSARRDNLAVCIEPTQMYPVGSVRLPRLGLLTAYLLAARQTAPTSH